MPRSTDSYGKGLPPIPAEMTFGDFRAVSQAGSDLAHWHLNDETVAAVSNRQAQQDGEARRWETAATYRVTKIKFGKAKDARGKSMNDKSTVIYNGFITLKNIPLTAYDY